MIAQIYRIVPDFLRKILKRLIIKIDGGEMYSKGIRTIFKEVYGIEVGIGSYGCFDTGRIAPDIKIGNYCSFAQGVTIVPRREHPKNYASTHPFFFNSSLGWIDVSPVKFEPLEIGNDVWIGQNSVICSKCKKIGNGAIIGAGSIVTRDVPAYAIVAGAPAKIIGYRFESGISELLEMSEWYNLSPQELKQFVSCVDNPAVFANEVIDYRRNCKN